MFSNLIYVIILLRFAVFNLSKMNTAFFVVGDSMFQNELQLNNYNYVFINDDDYDNLKEMITKNIVVYVGDLKIVSVLILMMLLMSLWKDF